MNSGPEFDEATWEMVVQSISNTTMIVDVNINNNSYNLGGVLSFSKVD